MRICPICAEQYAEPPTISGLDNVRSLLSQTVTDTRILPSYQIVVPDGYDEIKSIGVAVQAGTRPADGDAKMWELGYPKLEFGSVAMEYKLA